MALKVAAARASLQVRHGTKMGRQNIERDFPLPRVFFLLHTAAKSQSLSENSVLMESTSKLNFTFWHKIWNDSELDFLVKKIGFCHSVLGDGGLHLVVALFHDLPREKNEAFLTFHLPWLWKAYFSRIWDFFGGISTIALLETLQAFDRDGCT